MKLNKELTDIVNEYNIVIYGDDDPVFQFWNDENPAFGDLDLIESRLNCLTLAQQTLFQDPRFSQNEILNSAGLSLASYFSQEESFLKTKKHLSALGFNSHQFAQLMVTHPGFDVNEQTVIEHFSRLGFFSHSDETENDSLNASSSMQPNL